jgi:plastocyanin
MCRRFACTANRSVAAIAGIALVASAGCGGDDGGGGDEPTKPATGARPTQKPTSSASLVALPTSGYKFDKERLTARPGTLEIKLVNRDDIPHNVRVQTGIDCCLKPGRDIGGTNTISPGESITGTAPVAPGTYTFYCSIAGHWQNGMRGTLAVK